MQRRGFTGVFLSGQKLGQIVQASGCVDLFGSPIAFPDREGMAGKFLRAIKLSQVVGHRCQCVERSGQIVLRSEGLQAHGVSRGFPRLTPWARNLLPFRGDYDSFIGA